MMIVLLVLAAIVTAAVSSVWNAFAGVVTQP